MFFIEYVATKSHTHVLSIRVASVHDCFILFLFGIKIKKQTFFFFFTSRVGMKTIFLKHQTSVQKPMLCSLMKKSCHVDLVLLCLHIFNPTNFRNGSQKKSNIESRMLCVAVTWTKRVQFQIVKGFSRGPISHATHHHRVNRA